MLIHTSVHVLTLGTIKANLPQMFLFVLPLVPSFPPLGGFPASPDALWSKTDPEIMCLPQKFGSTATRYIMFPITLLHNRALLLSIAPTPSCRSSQVSGFAPGKLSHNTGKKLKETEKHARMLVVSQERRKGEGELLESGETTADYLTNLISHWSRWQGVCRLPHPCHWLQLMAESKIQQINRKADRRLRVFCQVSTNGLTEESHQHQSDYWESTVASPPAASASPYIYLNYAETT